MIVWERFSMNADAMGWIGLLSALTLFLVFLLALLDWSSKL